MVAMSTSIAPNHIARQVLSAAENESGEARVSALLARVGDGDAAAFELLYDRYHRLVFGIALRICHDVHIAEDVVQTVFLKVWRSPGQYRQGCFGAWLSRVARNQSLDVLRKLSTTIDVPISTTQAGETGTSDVCDRLDASLVRCAIAGALKQLRDEERLLIELGFFRGLTHVELARETGIPVGTVKTRIRAGLRRLRSLLPVGVAATIA
jgi:RNA polymerase sigma-70 factor, ECF subfamily